MRGRPRVREQILSDVRFELSEDVPLHLVFEDLVAIRAEYRGADVPAPAAIRQVESRREFRIRAADDRAVLIRDLTVAIEVLELDRSRRGERLAGRGALTGHLVGRVCRRIRRTAD